MTDAAIVERIWGRDAALWTGADEAKWLGWLDEPWRMREDVDLLLAFADSVAGDVDDVVLLGMGGSSLAPEVLRRTFGVASSAYIPPPPGFAVAAFPDIVECCMTIVERPTALIAPPVPAELLDNTELAIVRAVTSPFGST